MKKSNPVAPGAWAQACRQAMQWRLLLLWVLLLLIPTLILALPSWYLIGTALDHSVHAARMAASADMSVLVELLGMLMGPKKEAISLALIFSLLAALGLSPLLSGMGVTALRAPAPPGFKALIQGATAEYGRMLRLLLCALVPLGLGFAGFGGLSKLAADHAEKAIVYADTRPVGYAALALGLLLVALMHAIVDSARADFAIDTRRRSALKAFWRGLKTVCRRPLVTLQFYVSITVIALLLVLPLIWLRINLPHANWLGLVAAWLIMQIVVAVLAWMRNARLFALVAIARAQQPAAKSI